MTVSGDNNEDIKRIINECRNDRCSRHSKRDHDRRTVLPGRTSVDNGKKDVVDDSINDTIRQLFNDVVKDTVKQPSDATVQPCPENGNIPAVDTNEFNENDIIKLMFGARTCNRILSMAKVMNISEERIREMMYVIRLFTAKVENYLQKHQSDNIDAILASTVNACHRTINDIVPEFKNFRSKALKRALMEDIIRFMHEMHDMPINPFRLYV